MDITFLIGNGFDLNIGLKTKYTNFLQEYVNYPDNSDNIKNFKKDILTDLDLWSTTEEAFGKYTNEFLATNEGMEDFLECHSDFCEALGRYLQEEEHRLNYKSLENVIAPAFAKAIQNITQGFREAQAQQIQDSINTFGGGFRYNFISFNYTQVVEQCISAAKRLVGLGSRKHKGAVYSSTFGQIMHVHGYTNRDMAFGVNDESQIANLKLFEGHPEECIGQIIKRETNRLNEEHIDEKVQAILNSSDLFYIYGMSIGATDAIWWQRICECMSEKIDLRLIIHQFEAPPTTLFRRKIIANDRALRQKFLEHSQSDATINNKIAQRIHIDYSNIFSGLGNLVNHDSNILGPNDMKLSLKG